MVVQVQDGLSQLAVGRTESMSRVPQFWDGREQFLDRRPDDPGTGFAGALSTDAPLFTKTRDITRACGATRGGRGTDDESSTAWSTPTS